jgi:hypothetical protein
MTYRTHQSNKDLNNKTDINFHVMGGLHQMQQRIVRKGLVVGIIGILLLICIPQNVSADELPTTQVSSRLKHPMIYLSIYLVGAYGIWGGLLLAISSNIFDSEPLEVYYPFLFDRGSQIVESVTNWQDYWIEYADENGWNWPVTP